MVIINIGRNQLGADGICRAAFSVTGFSKNVGLKLCFLDLWAEEDFSHPIEHSAHILHAELKKKAQGGAAKLIWCIEKILFNEKFKLV